MELATSTATITFTVIIASVSCARFIKVIIGTFDATLCLNHGCGEESDDDDKEEESCLEESHCVVDCFERIKIIKYFIKNRSEVG